MVRIGERRMASLRMVWCQRWESLVDHVLHPHCCDFGDQLHVTLVLPTVSFLALKHEIDHLVWLVDEVNLSQCLRIIDPHVTIGCECLIHEVFHHCLNLARVLVMLELLLILDLAVHELNGHARDGERVNAGRLSRHTRGAPSRETSS